MAKKISRVPEILNLALYAGDGTSIRLSLTTGAGESITATGAVKAQIRTQRSAPEVAAEFATTTENGTVVISLSGEQTQALVTGEEPFEGVWDIQWVPTGGEPKTLLQGKVTCDADVTR